MRSWRTVGWISRIALVTVVLGASPILTRGSYSLDPKPPMRWDDLVACELVVVARYNSHAEGVLTLRVERVLKGEATAGEPITAHLEHRYSIETSPPLSNKPDGVPRLCYKQQIMTPGPLMPMPVGPDVRESAIYFFPDAHRPALGRRGQVRYGLFAEGWRQVLHGRSADAAFLVMQTADPQRSWDATDKLARTRDAPVLDRLVRWTINEPLQRHRDEFLGLMTNEVMSAAAILKRIGDQGGDVYGPLIRWVRAGAEGGSPRFESRLGRLIGTLDPDRALDDGADLLAHGTTTQRRIAVRALSRIPRKEAVRLLVPQLGRPDVAKQAVYALPPVRGPTALARFTRRLLGGALRSPDVDEAVKKMVRKRMFDLWPPTPDVTVAEARRVLLAPGVPTHPGTEAEAVLDEIRRSADPRFLPLLVQVLRDRSRVRESPAFERAARTYAELFTGAFREELQRQGVSLDTGTTADGTDVLADRRLRVYLHVPPTMDQLHGMRGNPAWNVWLAWIRVHGLPQTLRTALAERLRRSLDESYGPDTGYLEALLLAAPETGRPLLAAALKRRDKYRTFRRADVLALAIREGRKDLLDELIALERRIVPGGDFDAHGTAKSLLACGHPQAKRVFMGLLRAARKTQESAHFNRPMLDPHYAMLLDILKRYDRGAYLREVLDLAASRLYAERLEAMDALREFAYSPWMAAPRMERWLARLRPVVERLASLPPVEGSVFMLRRSGVPLKGSPGKAWLPALVQAAARSDAGDDADADRALRLVEHISGQRGALAIIRFRPDRRPEILRRWLAHRGVTLPPSSPAESASAAAASETDPTHTD